MVAMLTHRWEEARICSPSDGCLPNPFFTVNFLWNRTSGHSALFCGKSSPWALNLITGILTKRLYISALLQYLYYLPNNFTHKKVVKLILSGILLTPPESTPPLINEILQGCWKSNPIHRLSFQQIDDQLISEQRRTRRPIITNQGSMCSYVNPMEINSVVLELKETVAFVQQPIKAASSITNTVISVDYFQPIPDSSHDFQTKSQHQTCESVV